MSVIKVVEIIGASSESFDDAMKQGVARAAKTLRGVTGVDVVGKKAKVADGKITEYRVVMKVAFSLEE